MNKDSQPLIQEQYAIKDKSIPPKAPAWNQNQQLLIRIAGNFKSLEEENNRLRKQRQRESKTNKVAEDQKKILKLYNYNTWEEFMLWINEKLQQSGEIENQEGGEDDKSIKRVLSQIMEQPDFEDSYATDQRELTMKMVMEKQQTLSNSKTQKEQRESQLLAIQNGRLRKQNIKLKAKLNELKAVQQEKNRRF